MAVNLLHISDLHRDSGSQLTTTTLLHSLIRDRERYCDDGIAPPDIAIVSGDIVYGVKANENDADSKLKEQYNQASDFLVQLAETFFSGNRERIILVPGNHDISTPHVVKSTEAFPIPDEMDKKRILVNSLFERESKFRWDWESFTARKIINLDLYEKRMEPFCNFYRDFYKGARTFSTDPSKQFSIHDYPEFDICFAGLSSCHENDLYNRTGRIHPDALAQAMASVASLTKQGRVACAVWHHNLEGGPKDNDYVDASFLQSLMDSWCSIGLHGHQHRPQLLQHRFSADKNRGISIISAGTLCGGPRTLPSGRLRSYNIVEIDTIYRRGTVSIRQMKNTDFESPIWGPGYDSDFEGASVNFEFASKQKAPNTLELANRANDLLKKLKHKEAFEIAKLNLKDPYLRRIGLQALQESGDWQRIIDNFAPPTSVEDFLALMESYEELNDATSLRSLIDSDTDKWSDNMAVKQSIISARVFLERK